MSEFKSKITLAYENSMGDKRVHEVDGGIESELLDVYYLLERLLFLITKNIAKGDKGNDG